MVRFLRKVTKQLIAGCNVMLSLCMLLLYLLPFTNQSYFWFLNLIALVFPYMVLIQVGFLIFWLFAKRKFSFIPLVTLLLCFPFVTNVATWSSHKKKADQTVFNLMSWNTHMLNFFEHNAHLDQKMISAIYHQKPDVLALQEFVFSLDSNSDMSLEAVKKKLGFKYAIAGNNRKFGVHANWRQKNEKYYPFCLALFTNYPILKWNRVQSLQEYNYTFIWADLLIGNDTIRFFNVHLQSMHFAKIDYNFIENIDDQEMEEVKSTGRNLLSKIKAANIQRAVQINIIKDEVRQSPYPVVLSGDFNDVPNSYAYQSINKLLKDAHASKGRGIGRTFKMLSPTLRIDYIFYQPALQLQSTNVLQWPYSDHKPVVAEFVLPSK